MTILIILWYILVLFLVFVPWSNDNDPDGKA